MDLWLQIQKQRPVPLYKLGVCFLHSLNLLPSTRMYICITPKVMKERLGLWGGRGRRGGGVACPNP